MLEFLNDDMFFNHYESVVLTGLGEVLDEVKTWQNEPDCPPNGLAGCRVLNKEDDANLVLFPVQKCAGPFRAIRG
jgi:hypothetical protein